jgi:hypothetical protein
MWWQWRRFDRSEIGMPFVGEHTGEGRAGSEIRNLKGR